MDLKNQVAIVTGSSKGIGLATVKALLSKGVKVAGWSRSETAIDHPNFNYYQADVGNQESVAAAFAKTKNDFGTIAILINNAGLGFTGNLDELPMEHWHAMFNINVNGIFYCSRLVIPEMKKLGYGHIINISSIAGMTGIEGMSGYCATKFAVRGLSGAMFKEVRNFGIKVSCVYPGSVNTNFFDSIESVQANANMMKPEDIAGTIIHFLETNPNYLPVDIEVRPLKPKG
jgi:NADP-dependent 3-hydroxy acid dehydrogenase YdfG